MKMDMQQRRSSDFDRFAHSFFHPTQFIEMTGIPKIENQMRTSKLNTVATNKMVFVPCTGAMPRRGERTLSP